MRKLLGVLCVAGVAVGTASAQIGHLYFDLSGNDGDENSPRDGVTAGENPVLPAGGGRLFIYWQFGHRGIDDGPGGYPADHQEILGLGVDINIDNGGVLGDAFYYNPTVIRNDTRWNQSSPRPPGGGGGTSLAFNAANIDEYGLVNHESAEDDDNQFDINDTAGGRGEFGTTLLGWVDVFGDSRHNIWFSGNTFGIAEVGGDPNDFVLFGNATIVPEPSSLMLLGLGALAIRRRR